MKKVFYILAAVVIGAIIVGMVMPRNQNPRDFVYLFIMLGMYVSIGAALMYIIRKIDQK
jgi:hypothetical protein